LKAAGETILLIEHDMDFVRAVADRVIVMDQGKVLAEGEPEEVLRDPRVLDAYLGMTL
jgi:ABC-type branched-subunit amino acid transport system ATPase component